MRILTQADLPYPTSKNINSAAAMIGSFAAIRDMNQLAKALNQYKPNILVLEEKYVDGVVQAYRNQNNAKVICFQPYAQFINTDEVAKKHNVSSSRRFSHHTKADIAIHIDADIPKPNLDTLNFKEEVEKTDISVFCDDEKDVFFTKFLCDNYRVKAYGAVKIDSPRYLGQISQIEKYEILNKSKASVTFSALDAQDSVLLGSCPVSYSKDDLFSRSFNNIITLTDCLDNVNDENAFKSMQEDMAKIMNAYKEDNNVSSAIEIFKQLGFNKQATQLDEIMKEMLS